MATQNLLLGDCMDLMKSKPDKFWGLAIVDPPYGNSIMCKNKHQRHRNKDTTYRNKSIPTEIYYSELMRVSFDQIVWGFQYQYQNFPPGGSVLVWDKGAEPQLHNMSACDIAWYSKPHRIERIKLAWCGAVKCENEPTMKKSDRELIRQKFGGRCAYCGCELPENWQVDHFHAQIWDKLEGQKPDESFENLMPACPECNRYKSAWNIEVIREWLEKSKKQLLKTQNLRILHRLGGFKISEEPIIFYFETYANTISINTDSKEETQM